MYLYSQNFLLSRKRLLFRESPEAILANIESQVQEDTKERLADLRDKIESGRTIAGLENLKKVPGKVQENLAKFKSEYQTATPEELGKLLVAKGPLYQELGSEGSKIYRTEMFVRANNFLQEKVQNGDIDSKTASHILLKGMEELTYHPDSTEKALWDAMRMIHHSHEDNHVLLPDEIAQRFNGKQNRMELAKEMESGPFQTAEPITLGNQIKLGDANYQIKRCEILTGAAMTQVDASLLETFQIKNVIWTKEGSQIMAQMHNGCEGNLVVIDVGEGEEVVVPPPNPNPEPEPEPEPEPLPASFDINQILPEFAQYATIDPTLPGWLRYTEAFNRIPLASKKREIQMKIQQALQDRMSAAFAGGIDAKITAAEAAGKTEEANYLKAMKLLDPLKTGNTDIPGARALLKSAGTEGQDTLNLMNHDFERVRNGQMLAMFEATESSRHESVIDDTAFSKQKYWGIGESVGSWFGQEWGGDEPYVVESKNRINLIHKISPVVQELFQNQGDTIKTISEAITELKKDTIRPANITVAELNTFETYWKAFLENEGKDMSSLNVTDDDFLDKLSDKTREEWFKIAQKMEDEGQHDQAQQILEQIVLGTKFSDGKSVDEKLQSMFSTKQLGDIQKKVDEKIDKEMPRHQILKVYEEQGFFTDEGLAGFGLVKQASGDFLDPINNVTVTKLKAMNLIADQAINVTREKLQKELMLFEAADNDSLRKGLNLRDGSLESKALRLYQDISGAGTLDKWDFINISAKKEDFWTKELYINAGFIAASAAGVGLVGLGGRAVAGISSVLRGASAIRTAGVVGRLASPLRMVGTGFTRVADSTRLGAKGLQIGGKLGVISAVDGFMFHNINAALSTPLVGEAAWDNYKSGCAHSMGMYFAFGGGNMLWNKTVGKLASGSGKVASAAKYSSQTLKDVVSRGNFYDPAMTTTLGRVREALWNTPTSILKSHKMDAIKTIFWNQPKLGLEALAFTATVTDAEFGSEEYWDEFVRQYATMNVLWGLPKKAPSKSKDLKVKIKTRYRADADFGDGKIYRLDSKIQATGRVDWLNRQTPQVKQDLMEAINICFSSGKNIKKFLNPLNRGPISFYIKHRFSY